MTARRVLRLLAVLAALALSACATADRSPVSPPRGAAMGGLVDVPATSGEVRRERGRPVDGEIAAPHRTGNRRELMPAHTWVTPRAAVAAFARVLLALPREPGAADRVLGRLAAGAAGRARLDALAARASGLRGRAPVARVVVVAATDGGAFVVVARRGSGRLATHELYRAAATRAGDGWVVGAWRRLP